MPENVTELLWWGVSLLSLGILKLTVILLWFMRKELMNINRQLARSHKNYHHLYLWMVKLATQFNILHPESKPIEPPEWEE